MYLPPVVIVLSLSKHVIIKISFNIYMVYHELLIFIYDCSHSSYIGKRHEICWGGALEATVWVSVRTTVQKSQHRKTTKKWAQEVVGWMVVVDRPSTLLEEPDTWTRLVWRNTCSRLDPQQCWANPGYIVYVCVCVCVACHMPWSSDHLCIHVWFALLDKCIKLWGKHSTHKISHKSACTNTYA